MKRKKDYYVYILRCNDGSYYTGVTNDVARRIYEHQYGVYTQSYVYKRRPFKLMYQVHFTDVFEAIAWEKHIKRWGKKKKEALIKGHWSELELHAVCKNNSHWQIDSPRKFTRYFIAVSFRA